MDNDTLKEIVEVWIDGSVIMEVWKGKRWFLRRITTFNVDDLLDDITQRPAKSFLLLNGNLNALPLLRNRI